jgi:hypothetical protein
MAPPGERACSNGDLVVCDAVADIDTPRPVTLAMWVNDPVCSGRWDY